MCQCLLMPADACLLNFKHTRAHTHAPERTTLLPPFLAELLPHTRSSSSPLLLLCVLYLAMAKWMDNRSTCRLAGCCCTSSTRATHSSSTRRSLASTRIHSRRCGPHTEGYCSGGGDGGVGATIKHRCSPFAYREAKRQRQRQTHTHPHTDTPTHRHTPTCTQRLCCSSSIPSLPYVH